MKRLVFAVLLTALSSFNFIFATAKFDERLELTAIIYRLTGEAEANGFAYREFAQQTDAYFADFKQHQIVEFVKSPFNCVELKDLFELALCMEKKDNVFTVDESYRFDNMNRTFVSQYLKLLNDFYTETKFEDFYLANSDYYCKATKVYADVVKGMNYDILHRLFGTNVDDIDILLNSFGNVIYSFPEHKAIVFSGFSLSFVGNSKEGFLGSCYPIPEAVIVYQMADYLFQPQLADLSNSVLPESRIYFNLITNNRIKPNKLFGEYVKNFGAVYYLKNTGHRSADYILKVMEGGTESKHYYKTEVLYNEFAPIADHGLTAKSLKKFAEIYKSYANK